MTCHGARREFETQAQDAAVFLVYLWPHDNHAHPFRASVRRLDRDRPEFFTQAAALTDYLQREARTTVPVEPTRGWFARLRVCFGGALRRLRE